MDIRVGMAQQRVVGGEIEANLARCVDMVRQSAEAGCDIAVLPETLDVGWTHPSARELAEPIPGKTSDIIVTAAKNWGIYVVAGLTERDGEKLYNAAILIAPDGQILLKHRKINILDIARALYSTGDGLQVAETPWGRMGILICADNFPDCRALGDSLAKMGVRAILSPCAWAVPESHDHAQDPYGELWHKAYTSLCEDHDLTILGVSNVGPITGGPWAGQRCIGCSLAMGAGGEVLDVAPYGVDASCLRVVSISLV